MILTSIRITLLACILLFLRFCIVPLCSALRSTAGKLFKAGFLIFFRKAAAMSIPVVLANSKSRACARACVFACVRACAHLPPSPKTFSFSQQFCAPAPKLVYRDVAPPRVSCLHLELYSSVFRMVRVFVTSFIYSPGTQERTEGRLFYVRPAAVST